MTQEIYDTAKYAQDGISDMDDLLHALENSVEISFNIIERDETFNEIHVDEKAQDLFRTVLTEVATNYREKLTHLFTNL